MDLVKNVMEELIITCEQKDSLLSVAKKMYLNDIEFIPIVDEEKRLLGLISDRDVTITLGKNENTSIIDLKVEDADITDTMSVTSDENIEDVLRVMRKRRMKCIPVVDKTHRFMGLATVSRIVRKINGSAWERKNGKHKIEHGKEVNNFIQEQ